MSCPLFAVDLDLGKCFGHVYKMALTHIGLLFPWEEKQNLGISTYAIPQKWLKIEEENNMFCDPAKH